MKWRVAPMTVSAWNTSWYPKTPGTGIRSLHGVADRAGRVAGATGEDEPEPHTPEAVEELGDDGQGGPSRHDIGHGDRPLRGVQPDLADGDADGAPEPHQTQDENLGPAVHGEAGHGGVGAGDGEEDGGVIGPSHAPASDRGPPDAVEGGAHAEERRQRHDVDRQRRSVRRRCGRGPRGSVRPPA